MEEQDKRAVESLAQTGIDLDALAKCFPKIPRVDIEAIYAYIKGLKMENTPGPKINCS